MPNKYHQKMTHWARGAANGFGGYSYASPKQYFVRWETVQEQFLNTKGEISVSQAVIRVPADLGAAIQVGDYVYLGWSPETDPTTVDAAYVVRQIVSMPDLRNVRQETRVIL